ncbi:carboxypeptidase-like regulatory domain-containing protein [Penaeicola halotolerans]
MIEGVIKDSKQKEALSYANIFLKGSYSGTISNQNGQFRIIIPKEKTVTV